MTWRSIAARTVVLILCFAGCYREGVTKQQGQVVSTERGPLSYFPRTRFELPPLTFPDKAKATYRIEDVPSRCEGYSLVLRVVGDAPDDATKMRLIERGIRFKAVVHNAGAVFEKVGDLSDFVVTRYWLEDGRHHYTDLASPTEGLLQRMALSGTVLVQVRLELPDGATSTSEITVVPFLEGGGIADTT